MYKNLNEALLKRGNLRDLEKIDLVELLQQVCICLQQAQQKRSLDLPKNQRNLHRINSSSSSYQASSHSNILGGQSQQLLIPGGISQQMHTSPFENQKSSKLASIYLQQNGKKGTGGDLSPRIITDILNTDDEELRANISQDYQQHQKNENNQMEQHMSNFIEQQQNKQSFNQQQTDSNQKERAQLEEEKKEIEERKFQMDQLLQKFQSEL